MSAVRRTDWREQQKEFMAAITRGDRIERAGVFGAAKLRQGIAMGPVGEKKLLLVSCDGVRSNDDCSK